MRPDCERLRRLAEDLDDAEAADELGRDRQRHSDEPMMCDRTTEHDLEQLLYDMVDRASEYYRRTRAALSAMAETMGPALAELNRAMSTLVASLRGLVRLVSTAPRRSPASPLAADGDDLPRVTAFTALHLSAMARAPPPSHEGCHEPHAPPPRLAPPSPPWLLDICCPASLVS